MPFPPPLAATSPGPAPIQTPRIGFCCKYVPPDDDPEATRRMNQAGTTITALGRLSRRAAFEKVLDLVRHNIRALHLQLADVAARPPIERLMRIASGLLPAYTHPVARWMYDEPALRASVEAGLAHAGALARVGGVRVSMHPGQFCVLSTASETALANAVDELEYHVEIMRLMGFAEGWHAHGAHVNVHGGARGPGVEGFRRGLARLSADARNLITVENDEVSFGLDDLLPLAEDLPIVLDLHHHWIRSGGAYIRPEDPRIGRIRDSWRGVRPLAHVSVSREDLLAGHPVDVLPDYRALTARGIRPKDLRAHSEMMWNAAVNDLVADHLAWADFEVEAKQKNLASRQLARHVTDRGGAYPPAPRRGEGEGAKA